MDNISDCMAVSNNQRVTCYHHVGGLLSSEPALFSVPGYIFRFERSHGYRNTVQGRKQNATGREGQCQERRLPRQPINQDASLLAPRTRIEHCYTSIPSNQMR